MTSAWVWVLVRSKMLFLYTGGQKYFPKICIWWPWVTLKWFWPQIMSKMHFIFIRAQNAVWKFALDDLWWNWADFDLPWCSKCVFYAYELKNTLCENLCLMTLGDSNFKLFEIIFKWHHCTALKIPEILGYSMIVTCRLTFQPAPTPSPTPKINW